VDGVIRVLLVDDDPLVRSALTLMLGGQSDIEVVGEAPNGEAGLAQVAEHRPDVVLMDISMPGLNGLEATRRIVKEHPATRVIVLSMHTGEQFVIDALRAGAAGYVLKNSAPGPGVQCPVSAVGAPAGTYQAASNARKWSRRIVSTWANRARIRSMHQE